MQWICLVLRGELGITHISWPSCRRMLGFNGDARLEETQIRDSATEQNGGPLSRDLISGQVTGRYSLVGGDVYRLPIHRSH